MGCIWSEPQFQGKCIGNEEFGGELFPGLCRKRTTKIITSKDLDFEFSDDAYAGWTNGIFGGPCAAATSATVNAAD